MFVLLSAKTIRPSSTTREFGKYFSLVALTNGWMKMFYSIQAGSRRNVYPSGCYTPLILISWAGERFSADCFRWNKCLELDRGAIALLCVRTLQRSLHSKRSSVHRAIWLVGMFVFFMFCEFSSRGGSGLGRRVFERIFSAELIFLIERKENFVCSYTVCSTLSIYGWAPKFWLLLEQMAAVLNDSNFDWGSVFECL